MEIDYKKEIIAPAWELINDDSKVKFYYFFPCFLSTVYYMIMLTYQFAYTYVSFSDQQQDFFQMIVDYFSEKNIVEIILVIVVFFAIYMLSTPIFEAWLIHYIDQRKKYNRISTIDALWFWTTRFMQLLSHNSIFTRFRFFFVFTSFLFVLRFVWFDTLGENPNYLKYILFIFVFYVIFSLFINLLDTFSKYEIIINNSQPTKSFWISKQIFILNLKLNSKLFYRMTLFQLLVVVNFLLFLFFPIIFAFLVSFITSQIFRAIAIILVLVLLACFLLFLSYWRAVLSVFKTAVWYYAYDYWRKNVEDQLDFDD